MQTDLEETKAAEIAKMQDTLHEMQLEVDEANSLLIKEREAARKAIEEAPPVIKETPVLVQDTEKINSLAAEVEQLKVGIGSKIIYLCRLTSIFLIKGCCNFLFQA